MLWVDKKTGNEAFVQWAVKDIAVTLFGSDVTGVISRVGMSCFVCLDRGKSFTHNGRLVSLL